MNVEELMLNLSDAGCTEEMKTDIQKAYKSGKSGEMIHLMKKARCKAIEDLHESGRKVDCLDFLIRRTEKEIEQA